MLRDMPQLDDELLEHLDPGRPKGCGVHHLINPRSPAGPYSGNPNAGGDGGGWRTDDEDESADRMYNTGRWMGGAGRRLGGD